MCVKFQKELPGLDAPPWPGELGQRIYDNVSVDAWKLWEERMKMILNEYRLMPWQKEAQDSSPSTWRISSSAKAPRCRPDTCRSRPSNAAGARSTPPRLLVQPPHAGFPPTSVSDHRRRPAALLRHPMWFPVVGYQFDVRNCDFDYFGLRRESDSSDV